MRTTTPRPTNEDLSRAARTLIRAASSCEGSRDERSEERFAEAWHTIFEHRNLTEDDIAAKIVTFPTEQDDGSVIDQMVLVRDIWFYSCCEHHLLPFFGKVHIAYVPNGTIAGLSKFVRATRMVTSRLQVQERMTRSLATVVNMALHPRGVAVVAQARHLCMEMRGVQHPGAVTTTSDLRGVFRMSASLRSELFSTINTSKDI